MGRYGSMRPYMVMMMITPVMAIKMMTDAVADDDDDNDDDDIVDEAEDDDDDDNDDDVDDVDDVNDDDVDDAENDYDEDEDDDAVGRNKLIRPVTNKFTDERTCYTCDIPRSLSPNAKKHVLPEPLDKFPLF